MSYLTKRAHSLGFQDGVNGEPCNADRAGCYVMSTVTAYTEGYREGLASRQSPSLRERILRDSEDLLVRLEADQLRRENERLRATAPRRRELTLREELDLQRGRRERRQDEAEALTSAIEHLGPGGTAATVLATAGIIGAFAWFNSR